jgi:replicative DNA helicase
MSEAKHPLSDVELEQTLIGVMLRDQGAAVAAARAVVAPSDFSEPLHEYVVELIYQFDEEGRAINPMTLNAWIKHNPALQETNRLFSEDYPPGKEGAFYLSTLARAAPYDANTAAIAEMLLDFSLRRQAVWAMGEAEDMLTGRGLAAPQPIMPALENVVRIADEISEKQTSRTMELGAAEQGDILLRQISHQAVAETEFGMRTNLGELDRVLGGLYPETLIVAGGRPGMGKSVLGEALCRQAALQGIAADWWSIEMPARECTARLICDQDYDLSIQERLDPLHYEDLVKMRATAGQMERAVIANGDMRQLPISIFSEDRVTMSRIAAVTRSRVARKPGMRLIVIDHLHILMPEDRYRGRRVDELSEITGAAKRLAKRTGSIVVLLAQLSRDIEQRDDKRPFMSDFRDSGSIEQDADVVLGLYRGEYYANAAIRSAKNEEQRTKAIREYEECAKSLEIEVLKQRSGETKTTKCFIDIASSAIRPERPEPGMAAQLGLDGNSF